MAPVVAAALISAAASMAKAEADKRASSQGGQANYQVDIKAPDSNSNAQPQMKVDNYQAPQASNGSNSNGALIDAGSGILNSVVTSKMASDERLKNIFGENEDIIKIFSKIDAIEFTYNDKAKEIFDGEEKGIDEDLHLGIKAQDLEKNPLTASAVSEDENGNKIVDTKELTMANSAVISEICKRLEAIEKVLDIKVV